MSKKYTANEIEIYEGVTLRKKTYSTGFDTPFYDDILPSGDWVVPTGAAAPDKVTYTIGGVAFDFISFDGNNLTEYEANSFEITHGIDLDSLNDGTIKGEIHLHGFASTIGSGVAKFFFDMIYMPVNAAPIAMIQKSVLITIEANQQYHHKIQGVEFDKPVGVDYNIGDKILVRLFRNPQDNEDSYASDFAFMQCALHMPINSNGSRQRYIK